MHWQPHGSFPQLFQVHVEIEPIPTHVILADGFDSGRVLTGAMTPQKFQAFRDLHLPNQKGAARKQLQGLYRASREAFEALEPVDLGSVVVAEIPPEETRRRPAIQSASQSFANLDHSFSWIDPRRVVASQSYVRLTTQETPNERELFDFAFPTPAAPPFEVVSAPTDGVFYVVSASPHINNAPPTVRPDPNGGVTYTLGTHVNFIQVAHYGDAYYLRNGTHRLFAALAANLLAVPAVVVEAKTRAEAALATHVDFFEFELLSEMPRPPLIEDFLGTGAIAMKLRRRKFGWMVRITESFS